MEVQQLVRELGGGQDVALDASSGADEQRVEPRLEPYERSRDRERRVEMTAGSASGDEDPHQAGAASGSVAVVPWTRSFALPMFTSTPVMKSESTRFERP